MQMRKTFCSPSFTVDSAHVKYGVSDPGLHLERSVFTGNSHTSALPYFITWSIPQGLTLGFLQLKPHAQLTSSCTS